MNILQELLLLSEAAQLDFFHALTKYDRTAWSHPQDYGFHHHSDKTKFHGVFTTQDGRGKVYKEPHKDGSATYTCKFDEDNLLDKHQRLAQVLDAVKHSSPSTWDLVSPAEYKVSTEPCFIVVHGRASGTVEFHVKQDMHPSIK